MSISVSLVTDSTADVPADLVAKYGIEIVPAFINYGSESYPDDGVSLSRETFYKRMATEKDLPKTSAMPPGLAQEAMRRQLAKTEHVVVLGLSPSFSGIYNTFKLAADQVDPKRIAMFDSGSVSLGFGLQVIAAAEAAAAGGTREQVIAAAQSVKDRLKFYAVLDTLENLRRGGRISYVVAGLGSLLQIKPILDITNGHVNTAQRVRTYSKGVQALIDLTLAEGPLERMGIIHTNSPQLAEDLKARLGSAVPANVITVDATPAIGVHVGPGCLGVAMVKKI